MVEVRVLREKAHNRENDRSHCQELDEGIRIAISRPERRFYVVALIVGLIGSQRILADGNPTRLADAQAAVEANLKTPAGKAYDQQFGKEFREKHLPAMRRCKQSAGKDLESFWILLKLDKDGAVKEVLLYPTNNMGT